MGRSESRQQEDGDLTNLQIYDTIRWGTFLPIGTIQEETREKNSKRAGLAYVIYYIEYDDDHGNG